MEVCSPETKEEFTEYYDIRWRTLRGPWDRPRGSEKIDGDKEAIHVMVRDGGKVIGVARGQFNSEHEGQVRMMGVLEGHRGKGVGDLLLRETERRLKKEGAKYIVIHARDYALDFYKKKGYELIQKSYLLWDTIQHFKMRKDLI